MNKSSIVGRRGECQPDFAQFVKVLKRQGKPAHLPFYEHRASTGFISTRLGRDINAARSKREYWQLYADFWLGLGFDCIPLEIGFSFGQVAQWQGESQGGLGFASEAKACVASMADLAGLPWPDEESPIDLEPFAIVAEYIADGVKIVAGPCGGPYV